MTVELNKENMQIMTNFFEINKKGKMVWSYKKQEKFLEEMMKNNKNIKVVK